MPDNVFSPKSRLVRTAYHSIEEANESLRANGWDGEFRQLSKGRVTSRWRTLNLGRSSLISHHLDKHIQSRQTLPRGYVALSIVPSPYFLLVDGVEAGNHEAILMDADSEPDFVIPNETECETFTVHQSVFEANAQALFPRMHTNERPVRVFHCAPSRRSALMREISDLLRDGHMSPEDVSNLLTRFLELMAGDPENSPREKSLGNGSARRVARRAQEYIEENYAYTIRMEDLCRYTSVALRTLQRSFSEYFQLTPSRFIMACRLAAARKDLLAADPSHDTVTRIAMNGGLTHLGRFSVDYRKHFGESPRETLAKRAPRQRRSVGTG